MMGFLNTEYDVYFFILEEVVIGYAHQRIHRYRTDANRSPALSGSYKAVGFTEIEQYKETIRSDVFMRKQL